VSLSSDGKYIACGGAGGVLVWETQAPEHAFRLAVRQKVTTLAFDPQGTRVVVAGELGLVWIWSFLQNKQIELVGHNGTVRALGFAQDGRFLATGGEDRTIRFWDSLSGEQGAPTLAHSDAVTALSWADDGHVLAYGSKDKTLHIVDVKSAERKPTLVRYHDDAIDLVALSPDVSELASVSRDLGIVIWSISGIKKSAALVERGNVLSLSFVPGKNELVSAGLGANGVGIWNLASEECETRLPAGIDRIRAISASPNGRMLAFAGSSNRVFLWDLPSRIPLRVFESGRDEVRALSFSFDGRWLAYAGIDRTLRVADTQSFAEVSSHTSDAPVQALTFLGNTSLLLSGARDGTISSFDVAKKRVVYRFTAHGDWVLGLAASGDGKRIASGGGDRHVKLWDAGSQKLVADWPGHEGKVLSVDFSPNNALVASGSEDKSVRIWDALEGRELALITGHTGAVRSVRFAPKGDLLASASDDGTIRLWHLQALTSSARELGTRVGARYRVELVGTRVLRTRSR
jgi:WD40 repeat protein